MNQKMMSHFPSKINVMFDGACEPKNPPAYRHRVWMNSTIFSMKGKKYIILEGVTICQNHEAVDAIKFAPVMPAQENDYPIPVYAMSEQEFFSKVTL